MKLRNESFLLCMSKFLGKVFSVQRTPFPFGTHREKI